MWRNIRIIIILLLNNIKLKSCPSVWPSIRHADNSPGTAGLNPSSANTKCSSSACSKFVIASSHVLLFALQFCKLSVLPPEHCSTTWTLPAVVFKGMLIKYSRVQLTKQKVVGLNPDSWWHFCFLEIILFGHKFLLLTFETAVTRHPNHLWRRNSSKIKCPSSGNSNIIVVYWFLLLSILYSTLKALM